jgi:hypothetical protein
VKALRISFWKDRPCDNTDPIPSDTASSSDRQALPAVIADRDLQLVVSTWTNLAAPIRVAILAMIRAANGV